MIVMVGGTVLTGTQLKGIVLAGGSGTRLYPLTLALSKQMLPIYDKPMIYYPLSTLMLAEIRDILLISTPTDIPNYQRLLGDGSQFGISLSYKEQPFPDGLAQALILAEKFLSGDPCAMVLGDNLFYGDGFGTILRSAASDASQGIATIFGYHVKDPQRFGIVEFDAEQKVVSIEEKPKNPKSNYCVTGLYFYDKRASDFAKTIQPSARGELEITDLNLLYMQAGALRTKILGRGFTWIDAGTVDSMADASEFVRTIQTRQGLMISAPEEIAFNNGWISADQMCGAIKRCASSSYGIHLSNVLEGKIVY